MYIFGIDIPLTELLFVFVIALFIALIIILLEIRKLRKLILTEQEDIYRFEEDINELKPKEKEKHSKSLDKFVKTSLGRGLTKTEIERILTQKGWPKSIIDESLLKSGK